MSSTAQFSDLPPLGSRPTKPRYGAGAPLASPQVSSTAALDQQLAAAAAPGGALDDAALAAHVDAIRTRWRADLERVRAEFAIAPHLRARWEAWFDDDALWPERTAFTHGELDAAHVLTAQLQPE